MKKSCREREETMISADALLSCSLSFPALHSTQFFKRTTDTQPPPLLQSASSSNRGRPRNHTHTQKRTVLLPRRPIPACNQPKSAVCVHIETGKRWAHSPKKRKKKEKGATFVQKERENITKYKAKWKPGKPRARNIKKNVTVVLMSYFLRAHSVIIHGHRGNRRHVYGLFCASVHTFPPNRFSTKSINSPESQLERIRGEDNLCVCLVGIGSKMSSSLLYRRRVILPSESWPHWHDDQNRRKIWTDNNYISQRKGCKKNGVVTAAGVHAADRKSESGDREPYLLYFILLSLPPPFLSTEHIEYSSRRIREKEREIIRFPHNSRTLIVFQREIRDSRHDLCVARINLHLFLPPLPFSTARLLFVLVTQSRWSFILWIR